VHKNGTILLVASIGCAFLRGIYFFIMCSVQRKMECLENQWFGEWRNWSEEKYYHNGVKLTFLICLCATLWRCMEQLVHERSAKDESGLVFEFIFNSWTVDRARKRRWKWPCYKILCTVEWFSYYRLWTKEKVFWWVWMFHYWTRVYLLWQRLGAYFNEKRLLFNRDL